jgi:hypothetical protein
MSTRLREALDLLREIQEVEDQIARTALMNLWLSEFSPMTPVIQELPIVLTPTTTNVVEIPEGRNHFPARTKPTKKVTEGSKLWRIMRAVEAFPDGVILTDLADMIDEDLRPNLSSSLSYLAKHGIICRRQIVTQDRANSTRELWKFWPRTYDGLPGGGPRR